MLNCLMAIYLVGDVNGYGGSGKEHVICVVTPEQFGAHNNSDYSMFRAIRIN